MCSFCVFVLGNNGIKVQNFIEFEEFAVYRCKTSDDLLKFMTKNKEKITIRLN